MTNSKIVDYSALFELDDPLNNRYARLSPDDILFNQCSQEEINRMFYGDYQPQEPVVLKWKMGGKATDFMWTAYPPIACMSHRIVDLLLENHITGWATYPVEVYDRQGQHLPDYYGLAVKSYAGRQDTSRSQIFTKHPLVDTQWYRGLYFDDSVWDGSDIFRVEHAIIIVTRRVVNAFKRAGIKNVLFTPLLEVERLVLMDKYRKKKQEGTQ